MELSLDNIKKDFPIFNDSNLIYLDNASTTQKPRVVLDSVTSMYSKSNANVHRSIYSLGSESTKKFETARKKLQRSSVQIQKKKLFLLVEPQNQLTF